MRGYFEIGVYHPKYEVNIGTLWRSAYQLGAAGIFTIGQRYKAQASDTPHTINHVPLREHREFGDWQAQRPFGARLIAIEMGGEPLSKFIHPQQAVYLLGAEDHGLPDKIIEACQAVISIESVRTASYNVAMAGSIVMYHRLIQAGE